MRSTFAGLNTVTRGLAVQQLSLDTTGHNIANANTPGYSRQTVNLVTTMPERITGMGGLPILVGTGVDVESVTRARNAFIDTQYWEEKNGQGYWQAQADSLKKVEDIFHDTQDSGIQAAMNQFWQAMQTLAADAGDYGARTDVRETGNALVQTLRQANDKLVALAGDTTHQIATDVNQVNNLAAQIADLNKQIGQQELVGEKANDLRDTRDNLVDQLSSLAKVQVEEDRSGAYTVAVDGVVLVQGRNHYDLTVNSDRNDYYGFDTNTVTSAGEPPLTVHFSGGELASLFQARDGNITDYLHRLDTMAKFLMQDFNAQHKAGFDLSGAKGDNFFGMTGVDYTIAAPAGGWMSVLEVNADFYGDGGLQKIAAKSSATAGGANGDNILAMAQVLLNKPSATLGNSSLSDYYSGLTGTLGVQSQQAQRMAGNQEVLVNAVYNWRESVSGVNIDEEMANMIKFQKGYGAAARVLTAMDQLLDTLINNTGMVGR